MLSTCCCNQTVTCESCVPCFMPTESLSISIDIGAPTTLSYSSSQWTDGTYVLTCTDGGMTLTGGSGGPWTVNSYYTTCSPVSYWFDGYYGDVAKITDTTPTIQCPGCVNTCITCNALPVGTFTVTDSLGSYTATWNQTLSLWITPQLCSASSTSPTGTCPGAATAVCFGGTQAAGGSTSTASGVLAWVT